MGVDETRFQKDTFELSERIGILQRLGNTENNLNEIPTKRSINRYLINLA